MAKHKSITYTSTRKLHPDLSKLAASKDLVHVSQIRYAHDPLSKIPLYLTSLPYEFPADKLDQGVAMLQNAIRLFPQEARLPYRSTIAATYENRFWQASLGASIQMLQLIAADHSASDIEVDNGVTLARLAAKELRPGTEDRFNRATTYMYPFGNKERTELLAAMMVMQFLFDDKCEETSEQTLVPFVNDFVQRLNNESLQSPDDSALQQHIDSVLRGFQAADQVKGNAGEEVIDSMRRAFRRVRPSGEFMSVREYLDFRHENVGAQFVLSSVKFSICSDVNLLDPRLAVCLTLIKDHLAIVNDLASFDKEQRGFRSGSSKELINIVDVLQKLLSLSRDDDAKAMAYTYQLHTEECLREELDRLSSAGGLTESEWQYLMAVFACAAGNAFYSMISSRYGGESARIKTGGDSRKHKAAR